MNTDTIVSVKVGNDALQPDVPVPLVLKIT